MTGNSGKVLFTDGSNSYWGTVDLTTKANTDGSNATGTWAISISGNAATVTNGVYTSGSYSNPSWITSLNYSKLTGTIPTWNQNTTGNAATATNSTNATKLVTTNWTVEEVSGALHFKVGGVAKAKLDSNGNLTVVGNVTAYGTI
jgi:hypothetical protein